MALATRTIPALSCAQCHIAAMWRSGLQQGLLEQPAKFPQVFRIFSPRDVHSSVWLYAGHNKWSKVRHIKGPKDQAKSKLFAKFALQIRLAVKEDGPNPELNSKLDSIISTAKEKGMTKASIDHAVKTAHGNKDKPVVSSLADIQGPGGSYILADVVTDSAKQTRDQLRKICKTHGGVFGSKARHAFERKGIITVSSALDMDRAEEVAIEAGAEDVEQGVDEDDTEVIQFICDPSDLQTVQDKLKELCCESRSSSVEYIPTQTIPLTGDTLEQASALVRELSDRDDVLKVYHNIEA
ncbi:PREDICTED: translational activator of cytochrome c oxidase 1-like [Branchiostoma belcheri]|uniref:Translational activator of cytochrome c oxidase 1 n=1 Tax=Branchiostoma belcheri TaxID=7741 RepID=A0A6P4Z1A7_BRABE|nr:PREDICTED: translational activator of cytochrome c oxidase 1-like [Branchiostoma belcheri]